MGFSEPHILRARTLHALGGSLVALGIEPGPLGAKPYALTTGLPTAISRDKVTITYLTR